MYGQNSFCQSPRYSDVSQYLTNYPLPRQANNLYYPVRDPRFRGAIGGEISSVNSVTLALKKRDENREIIENFVQQFGDVKERRIKERKKTLRISEARDALIKAFRKTKSLEEMSKELRNNEECSDDEWTRRLQELSTLQHELVKLFDKLKNVDELDKQLRQRRKKRQREARRRAAWREEKKHAKEKRARLNAKIDTWIRDKRDEIEREKQIEHLRKDADIVLSDVRGKRNDARKFLGLLQELQNLRRVKVNIARARGENLPPAADQAFDNIIGQLVEQWSCLDREYSIEEHGLKLMLKTDNEKKIEKQKRSTYDDWERVLFGRKLQLDPRRGDIHRLVTIRHAWDKYVNFEGAGSRIPIGWIMPAFPTSAAWQKCLKRE